MVVTLNFVQSISVTSSTGILKQQQAQHGLATTTLKRNRRPTTTTTTRTAASTTQATLLIKETDTLISTTTTSSPAYTTVNPFEIESSDRPSSSFSCRKKASSSSSSSVKPVVIIPGFGASHMEYYTLERHLQTSLQTHNNNTIASTTDDKIYTKVVPVTKRDWALSLNGRPMTRILRMIDDAVQTALKHSPGNHTNVTLVGHSAGGWIARVYLGHRHYHGHEYNGRSHVDQLICLGTPHDSGEPVTRKNMTFVNTHYPGAFYDDVEYLNFAGDGAVLVPGEIPGWMIWHPLWMPKLSYKLTDPGLRDEEEMAGDGIVPLTCTFLDGATQNVRLEGVWHSNDSKGPWYGDEKVVRYWSRFIK